MLYFDHAATTPLHLEALKSMMPYMEKNYGNPSGVHSLARTAKNAVEAARQGIAELLGAKKEEVFFTSGGTEADNWAIFGTVCNYCDKSAHIISSSIEHHGVLVPCNQLKKAGYNVTWLKPDKEGFIYPESLKEALTDSTCLVSVMLANNEVGTIEPIKELTEITKGKNICFHTDAVQAVGHIPVNVHELGVDLLSFSAHKFYGPKGVGGLFVKKGTKLSQQLFGGGQEKNRRAGTENVAGIVGMHEALKISICNMADEKKRLEKLRDKLIHEILSNIPHTQLNGPTGEKRLPGNVHVSFDFIEGESLLMHLDLQGVFASTGSACSSGALEPSHMLMAMGLSHEKANGAIRFSLGAGNNEDDIAKLMPILKSSIEKLRKMSPLYDDFMRSEKIGL